MKEVGVKFGDILDKDRIFTYNMKTSKFRLNDRELMVIDYISQGKNVKEIANIICISPNRIYQIINKIIDTIRKFNIFNVEEYCELDMYKSRLIIDKLKKYL